MDSDATPARGLSLSIARESYEGEGQGEEAGETAMDIPIDCSAMYRTVNSALRHHSLHLLASTAGGHSDPAEACTIPAPYLHRRLTQPHSPPLTSVTSCLLGDTLLRARRGCPNRPMVELLFSSRLPA